MYKVLVVMDVLEEHKVILDNISPELDVSYISNKVVKPEDLADTDIIVGYLAPDLLKHCKQLKLFQLSNAGTEGFTAEGVIPEGAVFANASGAYGLAMSEYMVGGILCLMKKFDQYKVNQPKHEWKDLGPVNAIYGSKTLVVGFGDIGNEFGVRMNALGSKVTGIRKHLTNKPDYVESLHTMDDLHECLKDADIVATCLPGYSETLKVFNKEAFDSMKDGVLFINVGRGTAVDTDALCDALENGKIAGAILDVTDPEPLPADHKLWDMPNVLITPHVSGGYHVKAAHDRIIEIAVRNINHFLKGEQIENIVNMSTGYRDNK